MSSTVLSSRLSAAQIFSIISRSTGDARLLEASQGVGERACHREGCPRAWPPSRRTSAFRMTFICTPTACSMFWREASTRFAA